MSVRCAALSAAMLALVEAFVGGLLERCWKAWSVHLPLTLTLSPFALSSATGRGDGGERINRDRNICAKLSPRFRVGA
jgi:hypothetical protein